MLRPARRSLPHSLPNSVLPILEEAATFRRLSADTLFFCFYFCQVPSRVICLHLLLPGLGRGTWAWGCKYPRQAHSGNTQTDVAWYGFVAIAPPFISNAIASLSQSVITFQPLFNTWKALPLCWANCEVLISCRACLSKCSLPMS